MVAANPRSGTADMPRTILDETRLHPAIRERVANHHADIVHNVQAASSVEPVLVVGMAQNPFCGRRARLLDAAGIAHHYLEYGSYFSTVAPAQCAEDVDRLADLSDGVRQGHAGRRRRRRSSALIESGELKRALGE